jgi:hypothetical protein
MNGEIMWYDTDGACVVIPRAACTGSDGSGDHFANDCSDIGSVKHENKGRPIVMAYTPGIKSHAIRYADGTEKICAAGFPHPDELSVEQFHDACRRSKDATTLTWWSRKCNTKQLSRTIGLTASGGVLLGDREHNIPMTWLPYGHRELRRHSHSCVASGNTAPLVPPPPKRAKFNQ